jgi:transcriptional regulator with AAA-type ATPase domain
MDYKKVMDTVTTKSYSWGGNVRELIKEVQQSLIELQDFLRGQRNGGSS